MRADIARPPCSSGPQASGGSRDGARSPRYARAVPPADDLPAPSAAELAAAIRERRASAVEVVAAHLDRIERLDPAIGAFVTLVPERALREAAEADAALARGVPPGPLHGIPVGIKDL